MTLQPGTPLEEYTFLLQTGTPIQQNDAASNIEFAMSGAGPADLYCLKKINTGTSSLEVHILDRASNYQSFLLHTGTPLSLADAANFEFALGDYNRDGRPELYCLKRSNAGSGHLEVHILGGVQFQFWQLHTITPITQADAANYAFAVGDYNGDGPPDLYCVKRSGTASGLLEIRILSGASGYQSFLLETVLPNTLFAPNEGVKFDFAVGDYDRDGRPDLYCLKHADAETRLLEVHILSGASNYQSFLLQTGTPIPLADAAANYTYAVSDYDGDGRADVVCLKHSNTDTGTLEVRVLGSAAP
jgi:hypothetical protein